ncbi:MAG TPA: hypothetical protein VKB09_04585 [Thermomicrobiales bacterium]|nr:hypothetical protein [Thermomicrobiales bacterium]
MHFSKGHRRPGPVELAEHGVITLNNDQRWLFHAADIHCSRAPRNEPTSDVRQQKGIRRLTAQRRIELRRSVRARDRTKQRLRVRMLRVLEDPSRRAGFDHVAAMHDRDPVAILGNRAEVVADQQDRDIRLLLHRAEEIENLRLGCHIQTGRRFVGDEQTWLRCHHQRDLGTLDHATAQLMWITSGNPLGCRYADLAKHLDGAILGGCFVPRAMRADDARDLVAHAHQRIEDHDRGLEDHRNPRPANLLEGVFRLGEKIFSFEADLSVSDVCRPWQQARYRHGCHRLARPALADQSERFAGLDCQGDTVNYPGAPPKCRKVDREVFDGKQRIE